MLRDANSMHLMLAGTQRLRERLLKRGPAGFKSHPGVLGDGIPNEHERYTISFASLERKKSGCRVCCQMNNLLGQDCCRGTSGELRNIAADFSFCSKRQFELVKIEDPFVLVHSTNYLHLRAFLEELSKIWSGWPKTVEVKFREAEDGSHIATVEDLRRWLASKGTTFIPRPQPAIGRDRKYFHDRRIAFVLTPEPKRKQALVLLTGGVDRYMNSRVECSLVIQNELGRTA